MTTKGTTNVIDRYRRIRQETEGDDQGGFTLIELLIVIVVIGILAAVTVFGLSNVTGQSLTSACHADVKTVAIAAEAYHAENSNNWPPAGAVTPAATPPNATQAALTTPDANGVKYLRALPGNTNKYTLALNATGGVTVTQSKTGGLVNIDGENFAPGPDPCANL